MWHNQLDPTAPILDWIGYIGARAIVTSDCADVDQCRIERIAMREPIIGRMDQSSKRGWSVGVSDGAVCRTAQYGGWRIIARTAQRIGRRSTARIVDRNAPMWDRMAQGWIEWRKVVQLIASGGQHRIAHFRVFRG